MTSIFQRLTRPFTSSTMRFASDSSSGQAMPVPPGMQVAMVAAGCFWGVEHIYRKDFTGKGLINASVGYVGGNTDNPSYQAVCSGRTGHAEACRIVFDPEKLSYRTVLEYFYKMHDPTTANQQGADRGSQYRSGIFYVDEEQKKIAEDVTKKASEQWWHGKVVTEVLPAGQWWEAEKYHQEYLTVNPYGYECPNHRVRNLPDLK
nr:putative peptide methionine sulfoxide reductase [Quercus suber]